MRSSNKQLLLISRNNVFYERKRMHVRILQTLIKNEYASILGLNVVKIFLYIEKVLFFTFNSNKNICYTIQLILNYKLIALKLFFDK